MLFGTQCPMMLNKSFFVLGGSWNSLFLMTERRPLRCLNMFILVEVLTSSADELQCFDIRQSLLSQLNGNVLVIHDNASLRLLQKCLLKLTRRRRELPAFFLMTVLFKLF